MNRCINKKKNWSPLFLSYLLVFSQLNAQDYITHIPQNGKVVTVHDWLVSKPMSSNLYINHNKGEKLYDGFETDILTSLGGEELANIIESSQFKTPDGKINYFTYHTWQSDYIDLTKLFGNPSDVFTYLYSELECDEDQNVYLHIGSNDGCRVWINGKRVLEFLSGRSAEPSQDIVKVALKNGKNTILMKIDQLGGQWGAYVQFFSLDEQKKFDSRIEMLISNSSKVATIMESKVIWKAHNRYIGWPSITKTSDGNLLAVFSGNRDAHVCPFGITQMIKSSDNGKTWSKPKTINNTPLDDRDAGILETKKGTLLVNWFTSMAFDNERNYAQHPSWKRHREKLSDETINKWLGNWTRRSLDKGKTWEAPIRQLVSAPHGPIELKNGRLLYIGTANIQGNKKLAVEESKDDGINWELISTIEIPQNESVKAYSEPHAVELLNGKLVAMFRYNPDKKVNSYLRQSESNDGGRTWTMTKKTNIWGYPPHLILLDNGWLLVSYGVRRNPYGERVCISKDGGKSWNIKDEIVLNMSNSGDLGYPASVQLNDGSIITIYYQIDKEGEKTSLMQTHWKLNNLR